MDWTDHYYYNAQWQVLEVRRDTGSGEDADPREQYVWHPYYIDALATRFYDATMGGTQVQHYFTHDANFNVTAVLSDAGAVVERYHYTPYGELTVLDADFSDDADGVSDMENPYTFTGRRFDGESGLYQYRNRYYGAEVGRFVTRDPIWYADGLNLYEYVGSVPTSRLDFSGLSFLSCWGDFPWVDCPQTGAGGHYGCYCGQGNPLQGFGLPIDGVDSSCFWHDSCYGTVTPPCTNVTKIVGNILEGEIPHRVTTWDERAACSQCDRDFCQALGAVQCNEYESGSQEETNCLLFRSGAMDFFECNNRFGIQ